MGRKVEAILVIFVVILLILPSFFKISDFEKEDRVISTQKSTELRDFIQYDINSSAIEFILISPKAEEIGELWYLTYPKIVNSEIKSLTSKYSIAKDDNIEFFEDVKMLKKDGRKYFSQRAIYNTKTKIIKTPERFSLFKKGDIVNGINMEYFTDTKETKAKNVKAVFILNNR